MCLPQHLTDNEANEMAENQRQHMHNKIKKGNIKIKRTQQQ